MAEFQGGGSGSGGAVTTTPRVMRRNTGEMNTKVIGGATYNKMTTNGSSSFQSVVGVNSYAYMRIGSDVVIKDSSAIFMTIKVDAQGDPRRYAIGCIKSSAWDGLNSPEPMGSRAAIRAPVSSGTTICHTRNDTGSETNATVTMSDNVYHDLIISLKDTNATFWIDGTQVAQFTTNLPVSNMDWGVISFTNELNGAVSKVFWKMFTSALVVGD